MNDINQIKKSLLDFKIANKFDVYQHLQPAVKNSDEETKNFVNIEINRCCDEILTHLESPQLKEEEIKQIVRNSANRIEGEMLDTEDTEFCYELYHVISEITGVNIEDTNTDIEENLMDKMNNILKQTGIDLNNFPQQNKE